MQLCAFGFGGLNGGFSIFRELRLKTSILGHHIGNPIINKIMNNSKTVQARLNFFKKNTIAYLWELGVGLSESTIEFVAIAT